MNGFARRTAIAITGTGIALVAPVVPYDEKATLWWEPEPGAEICYEQYADGAVKELACEQYWQIANTRDYPQPHRTKFKNIISSDVSEAAIAFDDSTFAALATVSSVSFSHTTAGSDRVLLIGSAMTNASDASRDITAASYNSVAATAIRRDNNNTTNYATELYFLANPDTGAHTVSLTFAGTGNSGNALAVSLTGVDTSSPVDAHNGSTVNNGTGISVDVTTVSDNAVVVDLVAYSQSIGTLVVGASQTQRENAVGGSSGGIEGSSTEGPKSPAGVVAMSWSCTGVFCSGASDDWALSAVALKPAAGGVDGTYVTEPAIIFE